MTITRAASVLDLSDGALLCQYKGHDWQVPASFPKVTGWGNIHASEAIDSCGNCGRTRRLVINDNTGEVLTRQYDDGEMLGVGMRDANEARREMIRRSRARDRGVETLADARRRKTAV